VTHRNGRKSIIIGLLGESTQRTSRQCVEVSDTLVDDVFKTYPHGYLQLVG